MFVCYVVRLALILAVVLFSHPTASLAQENSELEPGRFGDCWRYRKPWRTTVCECTNRTEFKVFGDGIYRYGSNPCAAAAHSGILDSQNFGIIAIEPHPGLTEYHSVERNGIVSHEGRGGPGYTVKALRTQMDLEELRAKSRAEITGVANLEELQGVWKEGSERCYFDGRVLFNLQEVPGVRAFAHPRLGLENWHSFPVGTVLMRVTSGTAESFVGYWLFEDRFWGRVEGEMVIPMRFFDVNELSVDGRYRRGVIGLHRDRYTSIEDALRKYPEAFKNAYETVYSQSLTGGLLSIHAVRHQHPWNRLG